MEKLEPLKNYIDKYINNQDFVPILFKKRCNYTFLNIFYKKSITHKEIYKFIDEYYENSDNKIYLDENYTKCLELNNDYLMETLNKNKIKPVYPNIEDRVVYMLYYDDCDNNHHNN